MLNHLFYLYLKRLFYFYLPYYMKQFLAVCFALLLSIFSLPTFAQTDQSVTNLGDVVIRFCNNLEENPDAEPTKTLLLDTDAEVPTEICVLINNAGPTDIEAKLNFVDGTITSDASQKKACQPEWVKDNFWQYVDYDSEKIINVPAGTVSKATADITFPWWYAGISYWCVTLQIEGQNESWAEDSMFKIVSRRANFVDVVVDGAIELDMNIVEQTNRALDNLGTNPSLVVYNTPGTNEYTTSLSIKNNWNVAQEVDITPVVSAWFLGAKSWKYIQEKVIVWDNIETLDIFTWKEESTHNGTSMKKRVFPGQEVSFEFDLWWAIPLREGVLDIETIIQTTPVFDFESENITQDMRKTTTQTLQTQFFIMPWKLIIAVLILLVILWILLSRKKPNDSTSSTMETQVKPTPPKTYVTKSSDVSKKKKTIIKKPTSKKKTIATKVKANKDSLTKIEWIWPKIKSVLEKNGIVTYTDLASTKIGDLRKILAENNLSQHNPKHWKKQATLAKNGKRDKLKEFQSSLK